MAAASVRSGASSYLHHRLLLGQSVFLACRAAVVAELLDQGSHSGIRSSLLQAASHAQSSVDASVLQALHHEAHGMLSSPCKARWAWSSRHQQPSTPWTRSRVYSSKSCEGAPCTAAPCALFHQVDGPVRLLAVEELLAHGLHSWDSSRVSHRHPFMHVLLIDTLSRRYSPRGPRNYTGSPCKNPQHALGATSPSSRCPRKRFNPSDCWLIKMGT